MSAMEIITTFWPLLALQLILSLAAIISILRRGETKKLPKIAWVIIVLVVSTFGPILYFIYGKGELKDHDRYRD